eukprot:scaffold132672_cov32-Tisochrysis_lutea.AAC.2
MGLRSFASQQAQTSPLASTNPSECALRLFQCLEPATHFPKAMRPNAPLRAQSTNSSAFGQHRAYCTVRVPSSEVASVRPRSLVSTSTNVHPSPSPSQAARTRDLGRSVLRALRANPNPGERTRGIPEGATLPTMSVRRAPLPSRVEEKVVPNGKWQMVANNNKDANR